MLVPLFKKSSITVLTKYGFDINTRSENIPYNVFVEIANELC